MFTFFSRYSGKNKKRPAASATSLLSAQNFSRGLSFSIVAALVAMALWVYAALLFDRYFPWVSMLQGIVIGLVMQRYGRGLDWRFPAAAAAVTGVAAAAGSFLVALFLTGREFGTGALPLVREVSWHTLKTFFVRDFGAVGLIYMGFACALAAFYANRRLLAGEAAALKRHETDNGVAADAHD